MNAVSRRRFLTFAPAAVTLAAIPAFVGCKKDLSCADDSALPAEQQTLRRTAQYNDRTMTPGKVCAGCKWFQAGAQPAETCGGCTKIPGPIHPQGGCLVYLAI